jgi:glutathione S-transferase
VAGNGKPVLWHIGVSHYSEKARWALAYKGVEHERRGPVPGTHMLIALWLTRGRQHTFPVVRFDGEMIGDSTAIIAALEKRYPEPPLYPADAGERARALELEEWFDEQLGPQIRLLAWHDVTAPEAKDHMGQLAERMMPRSLRRYAAARAAASRFGSAFVALRFGVRDDTAADEARVSVLAALDRLEDELGDRDYLVGDSFTVADLAAASLFYPLVNPPEGPRLPDPPPALDAFIAPLRERRGYRWVEEMFRRHRKAGIGRRVATSPPNPARP